MRYYWHVRTLQPYAAALTTPLRLFSDFCDAYLTHDSVRAREACETTTQR